MLNALEAMPAVVTALSAIWMCMLPYEAVLWNDLALMASCSPYAIIFDSTLVEKPWRCRWPYEAAVVAVRVKVSVSTEGVAEVQTRVSPVPVRPVAPVGQSSALKIDWDP